MDESLLDDNGNYIPQTVDEERAAERGWKPEEMYEGEEGTWVDARTFNMKGELMDTISKKTRQIKDMNKAIDKMSAYMAKQEKIAYEKARQDILAEKAEALRDGDTYTAVQKDEELKTLERDLEIAEAQTQGPNPWKTALDEWRVDNSWYDTDRVMRGAAHEIAEEYVRNNPDATPDDTYTHVTKEIKKEFKHKFRNKKRDSAGDIAASDVGGDANSGNDRVKLTPMERKVAERFVKNGTFKSVAEYAAKMKNLG